MEESKNKHENLEWTADRISGAHTKIKWDALKGKFQKVLDEIAEDDKNIGSTGILGEPSEK